MNTLKDKIREMLTKPQLTAIATVSATNKPYVRYVVTFGDDDLNIYFATHLSSTKIKHIHYSDEVHLTLGATSMQDMSPYLQIEGKAEIITDTETKNSFWNPSFENYFKGADDPDYSIIKVVPYRIKLECEDFTDKVLELS